MKIYLNSVFVDDQKKALKFYTDVLGFVKNVDIPIGEYSWLTVASAEDPEGTQLLLEPNAHPAAKKYQEEIYKDGIPATSFSVSDIQKEFDRLKNLGVKFSMEPTETGPVWLAVFDDTCGNYIQIVQM